MTTSIKWNGKEVQNPLLRVMAAGVAFIAGVALGAVGILLAVVGLVILTPIHPIFRLFGCKGFYRGNGEFTADATSFERTVKK